MNLDFLTSLSFDLGRNSLQAQHSFNPAAAAADDDIGDDDEIDDDDDDDDDDDVYMQMLPVGHLQAQHVQGVSGCRYTTHA